MVLEVVDGREVRVVVSFWNVLGNLEQFLLDEPPTNSVGVTSSLHHTRVNTSTVAFLPQLFPDCIQSQLATSHQLSESLAHARMKSSATAALAVGGWLQVGDVERTGECGHVLLLRDRLTRKWRVVLVRLRRRQLQVIPGQSVNIT